MTFSDNLFQAIVSLLTLILTSFPLPSGRGIKVIVPFPSLSTIDGAHCDAMFDRHMSTPTSTTTLHIAGAHAPSTSSADILYYNTRRICAPDFFFFPTEGSGISRERLATHPPGLERRAHGRLTV